MARLEEPVFIKRYGGRRFYAPACGRYLGDADFVAMKRRGADFTVVDAQTGEDVTASVLPIMIEP
jgi:polyhydroxyalkanoate synthesis regulator protein